MDQNLRGRAGHLRDARPHPPKVSAATYWRRRVMVMGIGVGLVSAISWGVNGMLSASPTAGQARPPSGLGAASSSPAQLSKDWASPAPSPSPSPDPVPSQHRTTRRSHASGGALSCAPGGVTLSLSSPQYWYQQGKAPRFTVRAASSRARPCHLNTGAKFLAVVVTHSGKHVWSSADCPGGARSHETVLTASAPAVLHISWDRRTSSPSCSGAGKAVRPGEYQVTVVAGHLHSKTTNIVLGAAGATGP